MIDDGAHVDEHSDRHEAEAEREVLDRGEVRADLVLVVGAREHESAEERAELEAGAEPMGQEGDDEADAEAHQRQQLLVASGRDLLEEGRQDLARHEEEQRDADRDHRDRDGPLGPSCPAAAFPSPMYGMIATTSSATRSCPSSTASDACAAAESVSRRSANDFMTIAVDESALARPISTH